MKDLNTVARDIWITPFVREILNPLLMLLAAGAFILVLWGIVKFIANAGDPKAREEGRSSMIYGIIGLTIIFGAYAIINLVLGTFNLERIQSIGSI